VLWVITRGARTAVQQVPGGETVHRVTFQLHLTVCSECTGVPLAQADCLLVVNQGYS
jgi:hypothetical protein